MGLRGPQREYVDPVQFTSLVQRGLKQNEIAVCLGVSYVLLCRLVARDMTYRRIWDDGHDVRAMLVAQRSQLHSREAGYARMLKNGGDSPQDVGGPIRPFAKVLAEMAAAKRAMRIAAASLPPSLAESQVFLDACEANADDSRRVAIGEIADKLGWNSSDAFRLARMLFREGRFPFVATIREPIDDDSDIPVLAPEEIERETYPIKSEFPSWIPPESLVCNLPPLPIFHGPRLTPEEAEAARLDGLRADVKRYVREWKQTRSGYGKPLTAEESRVKQERERKRKYTLNNPQKVAEWKQRSRTKTKVA